jgi:hypothetical protein
VGLPLFQIFYAREVLCLKKQGHEGFFYALRERSVGRRFAFGVFHHMTNKEAATLYQEAMDIKNKMDKNQK